MPENCQLASIHWRTSPPPAMARHSCAHSETNTFDRSRVKGRMWQMTVQCKTKSDTLTSSPGASRGLTFAWLICFFKSLVRPCECDYTVYWSTCFTHFVILDSSTRSSTPLLPFFPPLLPFTKCLKYLLSAPTMDSKSVLGIWTSKCCS